MKTILNIALVTLLVAVAMPQEAEAQSVWERVRDRVEANDRNDRNAQTEREAQRQREARQAQRERETREAQRQREAREAQRNRGSQTSPQRRAPVQQRSTANQRGGAAGGPQFCRSGAGHPVHGMSWCYDKGFATPSWTRGRLGDIIFDRRATRDRSTGRTLTQRQIEGILGRDTARRVEQQGRQSGASGTLRGRWLNNNTLELMLDEMPVVRLTDRTGDFRVDDALVARYR